MSIFWVRSDRVRAEPKNLDYFGLKNLTHDIPLGKLGLTFRTGLELGGLPT
jgi:hypothetical protein